MLLKIVRNRTSTIVLMYSLYLYFLVGLSLRDTSKALDIFDGEKRSHIAICNRIQKFGSCNLYKRKRISAFKIDEIVINGFSKLHQYNNLQVVIVLVKIYNLDIVQKRTNFSFHC
jgi:hypothetical protein